MRAKSRSLRRRPGSLIYFGGAVHEVLADGSTRVREDLVPGSPKRFWKPKWTRRPPRRRVSRWLAKDRNPRRRGRPSHHRGRLRDGAYGIVFQRGRTGRPPRPENRSGGALAAYKRGYNAGFDAWEGRGRKKSRRWIQKTHLKKGALHRQLGIPEGKTIPLRVLQKAAKAPGKLGKRARLALTLRRFKRK